MTQQWLVDHLIRTGHMTETGATRRARLRSCPRGCGAWVVFGLDGIVAAREARVDPTPLSALGEALALLEGRYTEALYREGGGYALDPRQPIQIKSRPAGATPREDVLREHRCRSRELGDAEIAATVFAVDPATATPTDPPF